LVLGSETVTTALAPGGSGNFSGRTCTLPTPAQIPHVGEAPGSTRTTTGAGGALVGGGRRRGATQSLARLNT
jgi:hypothetical protein